MFFFKVEYRGYGKLVVQVIRTPDSVTINYKLNYNKTSPFLAPSGSSSSTSNHNGTEVAIAILVSLLVVVLLVDLFNFRRQKGVIYHLCTREKKERRKRLYNEL